MAVAALALRHGIGVAKPLENERYDLIFDLRPALVRIQCKWSRRRGDVIVVPTRSCRRGSDGLVHRPYRDDEIDAIAAYSPDTDECYLLPREISVDRAVVRLRLRPPRNNQRMGILWARDFEFTARLQALLGPIAQLGERRAGSAKVAGSSPAGSTRCEAA
jgi:hypothetical protein